MKPAINADTARTEEDGATTTRTLGEAGDEKHRLMKQQSSGVNDLIIEKPTHEKGLAYLDEKSPDPQKQQDAKKETKDT